MTTSSLEAAAASTVDEGLAARRMLDELMAGGLAGCFARVEPRRQARKYVTGLISELPRKNCRALAGQAGDATPDKMQRLLERAAWDAADAVVAVRKFAVTHLGDPAGAVLVLDESGQEKTGEHTAGVRRQYMGCAGRVANGINVVFATYAAPAGHAVIGARLYVPRDWADDRQRRQAAGIPDDLEFATKPALARHYTALTRHLALAMAALAVCATTAALARPRTSTLARAPTSPDELPPQDPGLIPLTVTEIKRIFNLVTRTWQTIRHYLHWSWWRRRHQARARWFHQRTRLRRQNGQSMITSRTTAALLLG